MMTLHSSIFRRFLWGALVPVVVTVAAAHGLRLGLADSLLLGIILAAAGAWLLSRPLRVKIKRLRVFAENLVHAEPAAIDPLPASADELGALGRSLRRTAEQWQRLLEQLKLESTRREAILKSMAEGVLAVDRDLRVIFCNDSLARLVGIPPPLAAGIPLLNLARDPSLMQMLTRVITSQQPEKQTLQLAAADSRIFEVQAAPLAEPAHAGAIAILHDITDIERLERVRKDFVANVSHELRTPLTAIRGYAESLLDGAIEDPEQNRNFLEIILNHTIRLNNIASDLLTLSDLESGRTQPEPESISIRAIVEAAMHALEGEAEDRGIHLVQGRVEEAEVSGSRVRLEQAVINLLDNAVKFNRPGGVVRIEAGRKGESQAFITVTDSGVGIPSGDLSRIFERFYRVDKARSREVGGTGLGLSIVKHTIERMNGTIQVESQVGKGSVFTVTLPAYLAPVTQSS